MERTARADARVQVYRERAIVAQAEFAKRREEWFANTSPRLIRALNIQRRAANKSTIHVPAAYKNKSISSPYTLCVPCPAPVRVRVRPLTRA